MSRKSGFLKRFAAVLLLPGFLILLIVLLLVLPGRPASSFEPPWLLPVVNTVFLFLMPFLVALIALRAHFLTGSIPILLMGCGILALGSFSLVAGLVIGRPGGTNYTVTIHNLGVLTASIFHLGSAFTMFLENPHIVETRHRRGWVILGYCGILAFLGLITLITLSDKTPVFFIQGAGPTLLRQLVLGITIGFFTASFLLFLRFYLQKRSGFLYWYSLALGLVGIGLLAIFFQRTVGGPVGWVGRSAQYLGGVYFLLAVLAALRSARERDEPIGIALASFFRKAEVHFRTLVETLGDAVVTIDRNKRVLLWNGAAEKAFGYSRQEAVGAKLSDLKIFDSFTGHLDPAIPPSRSTKAQQQPSRFLMEEKARRKDGSEFPVEISASAGGQDENIITFIVRDITERKQAEEALRESEERLQLTLQSSEVGTFEVDLTTGVGRWNAIEYELLGLKPGDAPGGPETFFRYVHPQDVADLRARWEEATRTGRLDAEFRVIRADGQERWLAGKGRFLFAETADAVSAGGKRSPLQFLGVNFDITERKRAEEELIKAKERTDLDKKRLEEILEVQPNAVVIIDASSGKFTYLNKKALEIYGFDYHGMDLDLHVARVKVFKPNGEPFPSDELPINQALKYGRVVTNVEMTLLRGDGSRIPLLVGAAPLNDSKGNITSGIAVFSNITELKQAEEGLRQNQKTFAELIGRAPFGMYIVDAQFRIAHMNASSQDGAFRNVRPVIGRDFSEAMRVLWPEIVAAEIIAHFRHTLETGEPYFSPRFVNPRHDIGITESYEWELHRMTLPGGQQGVICYYFDSTELREAEEALQKAKDELEVRVQERTEELAKSQDRLQHLASQLLLAQEKERKRVAVELHDGLLSELAAIKYLLEAKLMLLEKGTSVDADGLKRIADILAVIMKEARRIMNNLHPSVLDELGFLAAMNWICGEYQKSYPHISVQTAIAVSEKDISDGIRIVIFRVLQEAFNNFAKHGKGDRVEVSLSKSDGAFAFVIRDNGQGFDVEKAEKGLGLESMRERVELSGGEFQIESIIGQGTTIRAFWST